MSERVIFTAALIREVPAERAAFLDEACAGNAALRSRVESLLAEHQQLGSFMDVPPLSLTVAHPQECDGAQIGPYKLLQQIGEGGMGTVFMAEQHEPVKRRVALKVIKLGMDTRQVIARFEAERQALTLMDHPNIAKVLDAGTTDSGRPYFVMELVKGQPITLYCDEHRLTPRQRLELLIPVCQAIQHAHQKGIIHRDIKPTNILVAEYDEQPVPKVIDFGVAKATSQTLTEKTMFTGLGQIVGTLEYMSPEQAKVNQVDIDTRSDIYSLGVLLYELLTGSTPFDRKRLHSAAFDEMLRIIREEEPPKPSTRLSDSYDSLPSISALRHTEPAKLPKLVRGELDWIVMKALEKDRSRRYETANGFAADLDRYLNDEAVQACPPSTAYQLRKFVKRNRAQVIAGCIVTGALVLGVIGTSIGMVWALTEKAKATASAVSEAEAKVAAQENEQKAIASTRAAEASKEKEARARQRAETITEFVTTALKSSDAQNIGAATGATGAVYDMTILAAMDNAVTDIDSGRFKDDPETEASLRDTIGVILFNNAKYDKALPLLERALDMRERLFGGDAPAVATSLTSLATLHLEQGRFSQAEPLFARALAIREKALSPDHADLATGLNNLASLYQVQSRYAEAEPLYTRALAIQEKALGPNHSSVANSLNNLATLYRAQGLYAQAEPLYTRALAIREKDLGPDHPNVANGLNNLATLYLDQSRYAQAEPLFMRALAIREKALGPEHPTVAQNLNSLAALYYHQAQYANAEPLYTRALAIQEKALSRDDPAVAVGLINLAALYYIQSQYTQAEPLWTRALAIREKALGPDHPEVATVQNNLAMLKLAQGQYAQAEPLFTRALAIREKALGPDHPDVASNLNNLASLYFAQGLYPASEPLWTRALAIREKVLGPDHPGVLYILNRLAELYLVQSQYAPAEPLLTRALAIREKALVPDNADLAGSLSNLARARQGLGKTVEARQGFDQAVAMIRGLSPNGSSSLARLLWRSASARLENSDAAAALPELEEALTLGEKFLKPEHPHLKEYRDALAKCRDAIDK